MGYGGDVTTRSIDSSLISFIRRESDRTILCSVFIFVFDDKSISGSLTKTYLTGFTGFDGSIA